MCADEGRIPPASKYVMESLHHWGVLPTACSCPSSSAAAHSAVGGGDAACCLIFRVDGDDDEATTLVATTETVGAVVRPSQVKEKTMIMKSL